MYPFLERALLYILLLAALLQTLEHFVPHCFSLTGADAILLKLHREHKHYYKAGGGYPIIGWRYWKRRIYWLFTGVYDPNLGEAMGCVYSNDNDTTKRRPNAASANGSLANGNGPTSGDPVRWNGDNANPNGSNQCNDSNNNQSTERRLFDVEVCNGDTTQDANAPVITGKMEITDDSLIYRLKGRSPIIWPLRYLRSYGYEKDIFSFNCGRRCFTGEGVYVFKCSNAKQLFKTLMEVINNATNINSSSITINNPLPGTVSHSSGATANGAHEYQNLSPLENDHSNFATLPPRIPQLTNQSSEVAINRPHSSMSSEQASHTYLNSAGHIVIGSKSQPNYYVSSPLSGQCSQLDGSKTSLNGALNGKGSPLSSSYDSSTLPQMRNTKYIHHEYVNSNVYSNTSMDDSFMNRRKNSEQHLYENHEIPLASATRPRKLEPLNSKMTVSDDLSNFCYVNLDLESRKERQAQAFLQGYKSARTTPEPLCYIQLDLKNNANSKETQSQTKLPTELIIKSEARIEPAQKDKPMSRGQTSKANGKVQTPDDSKSSKENNGQQQQDASLDKANSTVPYAQIDFAKTLALSNSAANHRKL